jgi:DNA-binding NarL/FixJ family response regulator
VAKLPLFYGRRDKINYTLKDIISALTKWIHYVPAKSKMITPGQNVNNESADFEDIIAESVDVVKLVNMMKYADQKLILIYKAMGYDNWEIALIMGISERTIDNRIKSIKIFLRKIGG